MKLFVLSALVLASVHGAASADDFSPVPESTWLRGDVPTGPLKVIPEGTWSTSAELGAISTSGNTAGTSIQRAQRHECAGRQEEYGYADVGDAGVFVLAVFGVPAPTIRLHGNIKILLNCHAILCKLLSIIHNNGAKRLAPRLKMLRCFPITTKHALK